MTKRETYTDKEIVNDCIDAFSKVFLFALYAHMLLYWWEKGQIPGGEMTTIIAIVSTAVCIVFKNEIFGGIKAKVKEKMPWPFTKRRRTPTLVSLHRSDVKDLEEREKALREEQESFSKDKADFDKIFGPKDGA